MNLQSTADTTAARGRLGIVTGSGPEAGIDLWRKILHEARTLLGGGFGGDMDAPEIAILSNPKLGLTVEMESYPERRRSELIRTVQGVDALSDGFAIACNTLHYFAPEISRLPLRSRFFSMVDATTRYLRETGVGPIALLGSKAVMSRGPESPYACLYEAFDCEHVKEPQRVHALIYDVKRRGVTLAARAEFDQVMASLEAPVVVLACTELPLVAQGVDHKVIVDPTAVLARELVQWIYGGNVR